MRQVRVLFPVNTIGAHPSREIIDGKRGNNIIIDVEVRLTDARDDMPGPDTAPVEHDVTPSGLTTMWPLTGAFIHVPTDITPTKIGNIEGIVGGLGPDLVFPNTDSSLYHGKVEGIPANGSDITKHEHIKGTDVAQKSSRLQQNEKGIVGEESENNCKNMNWP